MRPAAISIQPSASGGRSIGRIHFARRMRLAPPGEADTAGAALRGLVTFTAFVIFGLAPLLPYFLLPPVAGTFRVSVAATLAALVALGLLRWRVTAQGLLRSVGETVLVGGTCAAVAYAVGWAFRTAA